jgi:transketolase
MTEHPTSMELARTIRLTALDLCFSKRASHIGGAYSVADILAVLYGEILDIDSERPEAPERDRLFYSKGHACTALYAVLEARGFFHDLDLRADFTRDGAYFTSHVNHRLPGVELSTGSLGHALGVSCGVALAAKRKKLTCTVFTILSDGELNEGSNWEAILFAPQHRLDNLVAIVDYNKIQSFGRTDEVLSLEPLEDKFRAFNWQVDSIDGHDHEQIRATLAHARESRDGQAKVIIAHTVKGKGVSFMEDRLAWHYKSPNEAEYLAAKFELEKN